MFHVLKIGEEVRLPFATNEKLSQECLTENVLSTVKKYISSYYGLFYDYDGNQPKPRDNFTQMVEAFKEVGGLAIVNAHEAANLGVISQFSYEPVLSGAPLHGSMWGAELALYTQRLFEAFLYEPLDGVTIEKIRYELLNLSSMRDWVKAELVRRGIECVTITYTVERFGLKKVYTVDANLQMEQSNIRLDDVPAFEWVDRSGIEFLLGARLEKNPFVEYPYVAK